MHCWRRAMYIQLNWSLPLTSLKAFMDFTKARTAPVKETSGEKINSRFLASISLFFSCCFINNNLFTFTGLWLPHSLSRLVPGQPFPVLMNLPSKPTFLCGFAEKQSILPSQTCRRCCYIIHRTSIDQSSCFLTKTWINHKVHELLICRWRLWFFFWVYSFFFFTPAENIRAARWPVWGPVWCEC